MVLFPLAMLVSHLNTQMTLLGYRIGELKRREQQLLYQLDALRLEERILEMQSITSPPSH